jgi:cell division transport system ATP-binding protein
VIIALDLCLRRGAHQIIDGLNLHIEKGEFVFICGQAGSGKTSLLRVFALQRMPASGQVLVEGRDIAKIPSRNFAEYRRSLGVIFQDDVLLPHHTLAENVSISLELAGWRSSTARTEAMTQLRGIGLATKAGLLPHQISETEKQLIKIVRALARRPKITLADEPFDGLDWQSIEKAMNLFKNAHVLGSTVVIATNDVQLVEQSKKRAIMLDKRSVGRMTGPLGKINRSGGGE